MSLHYYAVIFLIVPFAVYLTKKRNRKNQEQQKSLTNSSSYEWSILIKNNGQIYREYEENDLKKIGYHIFTKLEKPNNEYEIYISQKSRKELMWINKDYESECKITVENPEGQRIGYLPFSRVSSI